MAFYRGPGGSGTGNISTIPVLVEQGGTGANNAADARVNLGLGTISTQNANSVAITGGTVVNITDLAIADGGTASSTAQGARTNLLPTQSGQSGKYLKTNGTDVSWDELDISTADITGTLPIANGGTNATDAATARVNLGLEIGVDVEAYDATILKSADIGVTVEAYDATILKSADIGVTVEAYDTTILRSADIGVTVQGYDANILTSSDIGVTVQGYDANILTSSDIGVTVQGYDANILTSSDIGVTVQGYDANILTSSDIGVTVQGYDANILTSSDIGVTVQGYDANILTSADIGVTIQGVLPSYTGNVGKALVVNSTETDVEWVAVGTGSVTSVDFSVPTGFAVSGNPITTSGTIALTFDTGYALPTTASQTNWDTAYGWGDHATAGYLTNASTIEGGTY